MAVLRLSISPFGINPERERSRDARALIHGYLSSDDEHALRRWPRKRLSPDCRPLLEVVGHLQRPYLHVIVQDAYLIKRDSRLSQSKFGDGCSEHVLQIYAVAISRLGSATC